METMDIRSALLHCVFGAKKMEIDKRKSSAKEMLNTNKKTFLVHVSKK